MPIRTGATVERFAGEARALWVELVRCLGRSRIHASAHQGDPIGSGQSRREIAAT